MSNDEIDLSEFEVAPIVGDPDAQCDWCGEEADEEQGPIRYYGNDGYMHAGCAYSEKHGALATALKQVPLHGVDDLDPAEVAELEQRMIDNDGEGITPWWENR